MRKIFSNFVCFSESPNFKSVNWTGFLNIIYLHCERLIIFHKSLVRRRLNKIKILFTSEKISPHWGSRAEHELNFRFVYKTLPILKTPIKTKHDFIETWFTVCGFGVKVNDFRLWCFQPRSTKCLIFWIKTAFTIFMQPFFF